MWVLDEAQVREHILDVNEVEELVAAGDDERDAQGVQFHLELERLVMGPVEHVDIGQRMAFVVQLDNLPTDELSLLRRITDGEDRWGLAAGAHSLETAIEAFDAWPVAEDFVGEGENLRRRTVVRVDGMNQRAGMARREGDDVFPVGPAPRVDALRIVADGHNLVVRADEVDDATLQAVGVLKLVDQ